MEGLHVSKTYPHHGIPYTLVSDNNGEVESTAQLKDYLSLHHLLISSGVLINTVVARRTRTIGDNVSVDSSRGKMNAFPLPLLQEGSVERRIKGLRVRISLSSPPLHFQVS